MKILLLLATFVASSCSWPTVETWNLNEISKALTEETHQTISTCLETALNRIMLEIYNSEQETVRNYFAKDSYDQVTSPVEDRFLCAYNFRLGCLSADYVSAAKTKRNNTTVLLLPPTGGKTWTMDQLNQALSSPETYPDNEEFIMSALQSLKYKKADGIKQDSIEVIVPALDISVWNIIDVEEVKHSNETIPNLSIILQPLETQLEVALKNGGYQPTACLVTPFGVIPVPDVKKLKYLPRD